MLASALALASGASDDGSGVGSSVTAGVGWTDGLACSLAQADTTSASSATRRMEMRFTGCAS